MSSPHDSGGGRQQHMSLWRRRIRQTGRYLLAVSAGVTFGYLAYERPDPRAHEDGGPLPFRPGKQPDGVTDDASRLRIDAERNAGDLPGQVGWLRTNVREDIRRAGQVRLREAPTFAPRAGRRADSEHGADAVITAAPHSRGPPPGKTGGSLFRATPADLIVERPCPGRIRLNVTPRTMYELSPRPTPAVSATFHGPWRLALT